MITPRFQCEQDDEFIIVSIQMPHIKTSLIDYTINENVFRIHVKPYFLRLSFGQELSEEQGKDKSKYDTNKGILTVYLPKKNKGEFFKDLNMLTSLLSLKPEKSKPLIEEIEGDEDKMDEIKQEVEEIDFLEQKLPEEDIELNLNITYGFDSKYKEYFKGYHGENTLEILDLPYPDKTTKSDRSKLKLEQEILKFSDDYYL